MSTVLRKDSWSSWEDKILIDTMMEFANHPEDSQQDAFEEAAKRLKDRNPPGICTRWHSQLKHKVISNPTLSTQELAENVPDRETDHTDSDYLDELLSGTRKQRERTELNGIYLDAVVDSVLASCSKMGGRGAKSRIANDALIKYFRDKGLL